MTEYEAYSYLQLTLISCVNQFDTAQDVTFYTYYITAVKNNRPRYCADNIGIMIYPKGKKPYLIGTSKRKDSWPGYGKIVQQNRSRLPLPPGTAPGKEAHGTWTRYRQTSKNAYSETLFRFFFRAALP